MKKLVLATVVIALLVTLIYFLLRKKLSVVTSSGNMLRAIYGGSYLEFNPETGITGSEEISKDGGILMTWSPGKDIIRFDMQTAPNSYYEYSISTKKVTEKRL